MIRWIVGTSLKYRYIVLALAAALMLYGMAQLPSAPVDVFPEFAPPRVEIQTPSLGLSAEEVEALVTVPLEQAFNGVEGLETMRSKSIPDLSSIELLFEPGTDELLVRQLVQERLSQVLPTLPTWAAPPVIMPPVSTTGRVVKIGLSSQTVSLMDMSMIAYWTIRARLLRVPGVANVAIWGERIKMPQVQVDTARMQTYDVSLDQVMQTTADALDVGILKYSNGAVIGTGGFINTPNQQISVRSVLPIVTPDDLAQVAIAGKQKQDGTPLVLSDVADVREATWPLIGDAIINDGPGLMLVVEKFPWANTLDVTRGVEDALASLRPGLPGIEMDSTIFRPADFIQLALDNLMRALILGCILVMLVIVAFLFEWRTALISLIAIPLSLVAAALVLYLRGGTINTMILAGFVIAIGVVVDDAIIDVENIVRRLRQARKEGAPAHYPCHVDRRRGLAADLLHGRALRCFLPAAGRVVRVGGDGVHVGGPDGDAGAVPDPAGARAHRAPRGAAGTLAPAHLYAGAGAHHQAAGPGLRRHWGRHTDRRGGAAAAGRIVVSRV
jgi:Cu/Ag efflux pump CusA